MQTSDHSHLVLASRVDSASANHVDHSLGSRNKPLLKSDHLPGGVRNLGSIQYNNSSGSNCEVKKKKGRILDTRSIYKFD